MFRLHTPGNGADSPRGFVTPFGPLLNAAGVCRYFCFVRRNRCGSRQNQSRKERHSATQLTHHARFGGCAGKIGPGDLSNILCGIDIPEDANVIAGLKGFEDAGAYRISDVYADKLPYFPEAEELAVKRFLPSGLYRSRDKHQVMWPWNTRFRAWGVEITENIRS